jgi:Ribbon-helix-helix protein, copG family
VLKPLGRSAQPCHSKQFMSVIKSMAKQAKKPRGRPATGHDPQYSVRLPKQIVAAIDKIAKETHSGRAATMRQLITEALEARKRS